MGRRVDPVSTRVLVMEALGTVRPGAVIRVNIGEAWPPRLTVAEAEQLRDQLGAAIEQAKALPPEPPRTGANTAALPAA